MSRFIWRIIVYCLWFFDHLSAQVNPCPDYWSYVKQGGNYRGRLLIQYPPTNESLKVKLVLSIAGHLPTNYEGSIHLLNDEKTAIKDLQAGRKLEYQVIFPTQQPLPLLLDFSINDYSICRGTKAPGTIATNIKLIHVLNQNNKSSGAPPKTPNTYPNQQSQASSKPSNTYSNQQQQSSSSSHDVCGVTYETAWQSLVVNGDTYQRGSFPWLSALIFKNKFICGGTLVSKNHVITAAHCIHNEYDYRQRFGEMHFILGAHNLHEPDVVTRRISTFITHPDWNPNTEVYDSDIALAVFSSSVQFTKFIRPACLYSSRLDFENLDNQVGTLAGWGITENYELSTHNPRKISIPVVSDNTCLRSNPIFYRILSYRTFCAGTPGKGPCEGDSGGGLLIQSNGIWVLRGIISGSIKWSQQRCNVYEYSVFTNVAKYDKWIRSYIG